MRRHFHGLSHLLSAIPCLLAISSPAAAQQLKLLEKMPGELLRYTGGAKPNDKGWVGYNQTEFRSPEFQCGAMHYMVRAIVRQDERCIDVGWSAVDATFREQNNAGGFSRPGSPRGGPSAAAFWLAELDQAVLILRESRFAPKYKRRLDDLLPKIRKTARWLAEPRHQEQLQRADADTPNRLLFDALAFGLSGVLLDGANPEFKADAELKAELKQLGRRFVDLAMAKYRDSDGVFLERGGHDSSYQAVAALKLQIWTLYFPDKKLETAADRAVRWELGRIGADGQIGVAGNTRTGLGQERWIGHEKDVNQSEVTLCLLYDYARTGNEDSLAAARRIVDRRNQPAKKT